MEPQLLPMIGIQVVSWAGATPSTPATAWFGAAGGDIGRSAECTLSLPDPERHISRRHAVVVMRQGRYVLQSLSANVALVLDGVTLAPGDEAPLAAGMRITLGAYTLQVLDEPESLSLPPPIARRPACRQTSAPAAAWPPSAAAAARRRLTPTGRRLRRRPTTNGPRSISWSATPARWRARRSAAPTDWARALQQGLGVATGGLEPEHARRVGELLRAMTGGTLELLTARMVAKRELGASATQLRTRENNPLKFSPDVDAALSHLLGPAERGFLAPQAAVAEAFDDLRAHQVALLAGMRAALDTVMSRFDPQGAGAAPGPRRRAGEPDSRQPPRPAVECLHRGIRAHRQRDRRRLRHPARPRLPEGLPGPVGRARLRGRPQARRRRKA